MLTQVIVGNVSVVLVDTLIIANGGGRDGYATVGFGRKEATMKFSEFANKLYPAIGRGKSTHKFTHTILDAIVSDGGTEILETKSENTYKAYYNGIQRITKLAKEISIYVESTEFQEYLEQFPDQSIKQLSDTFAKYIDGITSFNAAEMISEFFADIIYEAVGEKRKSYSKKTADYAESEFTGETTQGCQQESLTLVQQQNNVIMNGENNLNLTNHGTMNFSIEGD